MRNEQALFRIGNRELYEDMVLVDYIYPVLFTCIDDYGAMYIAACYQANGDAMKWLISRTTQQKLVELLQNKRSIRDMFSADKLWLGCRRKESDATEIVAAKEADIEPSAFPTADVMMDAEDGEFGEEIAELEKRLEQRSDKTQTLEYKIVPVMRISSVQVATANFRIRKTSKTERKRVGYSVSARTNAYNKIWA